jgi:hypothetical protein
MPSASRVRSKVRGSRLRCASAGCWQHFKTDLCRLMVYCRQRGESQQPGESTGEADGEPAGNPEEGEGVAVDGGDLPNRRTLLEVPGPEDSLMAQMLHRTNSVARSNACRSSLPRIGSLQRLQRTASNSSEGHSPMGADRAGRFKATRLWYSTRMVRYRALGSWFRFVCFVLTCFFLLAKEITAH